ncbi:MAG TPA: hypothetical protein VF467_13455 [Afipia sp.]
MTIASFDGIQPKQGMLTKAVHQIPVWLWFGAGLFALSVIGGNRALQDADTYWQIVIGQSIIDHHAFPFFDTFSFTKTGAPWMSSSWLAQVLYALAYGLAGWAGPVILASLAIGGTFALLLHILSRRFTMMHATIVTMMAVLLSSYHFHARPHVLALPVMLAWVYGLISASDEGKAPSLWLLPLIVLWANLHGGFILGLALIGPFALDALWNADAKKRKRLTVRWAAFGVAALVASWITPYGWNSLLAARSILDLGGALAMIPEWQPADFSSLDILEICLLGVLALVLTRGVVLSPPRILLALGFLHMALSHNRNWEVLALLAPLVVAKPLAAQFPKAAVARVTSSQPWLASAIFVAALGAATWAFVANHQFSPVVSQTPAAAIDVLKNQKAQRIFHSPGFGGYMIWTGIPTFIDGRAELYGEKFVVDTLNAIALKNVDLFLSLLQTYRIDATLLTPQAPAVSLLDHLDGWQRIYADDLAVVHVRKAGALSAGEKIRPASQ